MESIYFVSLGCPKNLVDSEVMLGLLARDGFLFVMDPAEADIIIINTCAFIEDAKKEAIDTILEMGAFKKKGKCKMLVVTGCLPQRYESELEVLMPEVDLFVGAGEFNKIVKLINEFESRKAEVGKPAYLYDHNTPRIRMTPPHAAYIKIAEGCFHPCSFCVIPKIRGGYRSRGFESIVKEAQMMIDSGVKEINLIAQDTTAYGKDLNDGSDLAKLLRRLSEMEGDKWIRILYAYPHNFPKDIISVMKDYAEVCPYLDIPIQHISERILKSMNREGGPDEIRALIEKLRHEIPNIFLRTSLIVGYPGETDEEFQELLDFVSWAKIDHLGAFAYSEEEGTKAAGLKKKVPQKVVRERHDQLMRLQQEISFDKNRSRVGKVMQVLVEGESAESGGLLQARHSGQAPEIDGQVYIKEGHARIGDFAMVKIKEFDAYDLTGDIVSPVSVLREE
jgi:ribosomal protein S12 methylthiotransferase